MVFGLIATASAFYYYLNNPGNDVGVACTQEAKQCPDGSYVGRTGPNCEFAACPVTTNSDKIILRAKLNQTVERLGLSVTPLQVLEDSRCPVDVQCIWAGRVRLKAEILSGAGTSEMILETGTPVTSETKTILLKDVSPSPKAGKKISPENYEFVFEISKR